MRRLIRSTGLAAGFAVAALLCGSVAMAAGTAPEPSTSGADATAKCAKFKAKSAEWKKCMAENKSSMNTEELYSTGYTLAKSGDYTGALEFLTAGNNKQDVRFLTMIGYSTRKLGKVDEGMGYYMQALALDPNSVTTREYLGEAYLQKHDVSGAKLQLAEIEKRCGVTCETYTQLNTEIAKVQ